MNRKAARTAFLAASVMLARICLADTIVISSSDPAMTPGLAADELELQELGIDPGSFVFTGNTQWGFTGLQNLEILSAELNQENNGIVAGSTQQTVVTIGDSSAVSASASSSFSSSASSAAPEPGAIALCVTGLALLFGVRLMNYRRSGASLP